MDRGQRHESFGRSLQRIVAAVALGGVPACGGGAGASSPLTATADASADAGVGASADASTADVPPAAADPCASVLLDAAAYDDSGSTCSRYVELPCGLSPEASLTGCSLDPVTCKDACQVSAPYGCSLAAVSCDDGGLVTGAAVVLDCVLCPGAIGRRPRGLQPAPPHAAGAHPVGRHFARAAHLEAASVTAFRDLYHSLIAFGAPRTLQRAALRASADERRHALVVGRLARRYGVRPRRPRIATPKPMAWEAFLADNVVEGCLGEAYGALVARWQAAHATEPTVARAMRRIAEDETRHASLAWRLLRWAARRVDAPARARLRALVSTTLCALRQQIALDVDLLVADVAGLPRPDVARALFARFEELALERTGQVLGSPHCAAL